MLKKFIFLVKRVIFACLFIYAYDSFAFSLNVIIPINFVTIFLVSLFGVPAMFGLILFSFLF